MCADVTSLPVQPQKHDLRFYGRRKSKPLTAKIESLYNLHWPYYALTIAQMRTVKSLTAFFPPAIDSAKAYRAVFLEVGCGAGEHIHFQARQHPDHDYIAVEPFLNGRARLLADAVRESMKNLRIADEDIRALLPLFPDTSLDGVYILYPDPWPKLRHVKRRLIQGIFLQILAQKMKAGAPLYIATDDPGYQQWIWRACQDSPYFETISGCCEDYTQPYDSWISTRYEKKALQEGRQPLYFIWKRTKVLTNSGDPVCL
ncbi:MAG: tRNA (guanosine(46)-N7)-methyltransferase TrmB [Alphaproteobacteria bacterium]|nr:MAG: tRNA (guanosine(46)-N7)-methyltransferase TrmB [Alphaproteobacteria bacterium]